MGNQESVPAQSKKKDKRTTGEVNKKNINRSIPPKRNNDVINDFSNKPSYYNPPPPPTQKSTFPILPPQPEFNNKRSHNELVIERNINNLFIEKNNSNTIFNYPTNSNTDIYESKPTLDNIKFTPYNFTEEMGKFKKTVEDEDIEEKKRRERFEETKKDKYKFIEEQTKKFEEKYNPWNILQIEQDSLDINEIKRGYKKMALKYHPDKAGDKYIELFQIITQSYIYLLKKAEDNIELEVKTSKKVEKVDYEDNINESVENIYISKDKFDINQFNKIFDKYKVPDSFDNGYADLMKDEGGNKIENNKEPVFGKSFNKDIFNSHFDDIKKTKRSQDIIEYREPDALNLSTGMNPYELGVDKLNDFGYSNSNNLSYTDYKKAHFDENLLIDANTVKYNTYNSIDQLENERSRISYTASVEDKQRYELMDRKRMEDDNLRMKHLQHRDEMIQNRFQKINQKLIVHK
jgi:hypothetical protein